MAKARRQNTGETEGSARAFAASETAESHGDRDGAQKREKDETSGGVTRGNTWWSEDLLALPSRQQHPVGGRAEEMKWEGSDTTPIGTRTSQSCFGDPACLTVTSTSCTSCCPETYTRHSSQRCEEA